MANGITKYILEKTNFVQFNRAQLLSIIVFLVLLVGHYRTEVHAWYVIKEGVLLKKAEAKAREEGKSNSQRNYVSR